MNVLIFVITLLMLLSLMTYARLDIFRNTQAFQMYFNVYMENDERNYINSIALKKYKTTKGSSKKGAKTPVAPRVAASPRINIKALVNPKGQETTPQQAEQLATLLKNLMTTLYATQPFFQNIQRERPDFLNELVSAIMQAASQLPETQRIKTASDLANLKLPDLELNEVFYKMLHGASYSDALDPQINQKESLTSESAETPTTEDDQNDQPMIAKEAEEFKSQKGYYSLLDFLTVGPSSKIRVYLAPREVLKTIYHDHVVDEIIRERQALYEQAISDEKGSNKEALKEAFRSMFDRHKSALMDENLLDYSVTKTNPKNYQ